MLKDKIEKLFEGYFDEEDKYKTQQFEVGDKVTSRTGAIPMSAKFKGVGEVVSVKELRFASQTLYELQVKLADGEIHRTRNDLVELVDGFDDSMPKGV